MSVHWGRLVNDRWRSSRHISASPSTWSATSTTQENNCRANRKHLYNIWSMLDQRRRRWVDNVHMLYKCFLFAGCTLILALLRTSQIAVHNHVNIVTNDEVFISTSQNHVNTMASEICTEFQRDIGTLHQIQYSTPMNDWLRLTLSSLNFP